MPVSEKILREQLSRTLESTNFRRLGTRYAGKVRDTYASGDNLILVTTDRISAFDHILPRTIPFKGQVLNQTAAYFFESTGDAVPNALISVADPNVTIARRCEPSPIEFVVRGYLAGHAWREYRNGSRTLCGKALAEGLHEGERLPEPVLTPATKAAEGHDEDISRKEILRRGLLTKEEFDRLEQMALALFERGTEMASRRGLLLVDTKYEFGRTDGGSFLLIDEVHTPDSSRYYYAEGYEERLASGRPQRQLSKEFVREWLMERGFQGRPGQTMPDMPDEFRVHVARRYIELFEAVTGRVFEPDTHPHPEERIRAALS